ncbi:MAG TPA: DoxX family protein [Thermoanaerobaculia bacterium]|jgi:putative oxidoreductase
MTTLQMHDHDSLTASAFRRTVATIVGTDASWTSLVLRLILGIVILPHGLQKTVGLFGGYGFSATLGYFESVGIPAAIGVLGIAAESLGALALIFGFATRIAALGVGATIGIAALMMHRAHFFMNWSGTQGGEGFEYHLLVVGIATALVIGGAGRASIDRFLSNRI